jgi:hypothetical protein
MNLVNAFSSWDESQLSNKIKQKQKNMKFIFFRCTLEKEKCGRTVYATVAMCSYAMVEEPAGPYNH